MLQQTTIQSVIKQQRFEKFLAQFPTPQSIALEKESKLLIAWEGLGYYNRVRNLQKTAQTIIQHHNGEFPTSYEEVKSLPGIGPYTAAAILSFAYDKAAPLVDGNVYRLFSRLFDDPTPIDETQGQKIYWQYASNLLPRKNARLYNSALMEIGQEYCRPQQPACQKCPVSNFCHCSDPSQYPVRSKKRQIIKKEERAIFDVSQNKTILLEQETGSQRKGFWRLPRIASLCSINSEVPPIAEISYWITTFHIRLKVHSVTDFQQIFQTSPRNRKKIALSQLEDIPISSPERKLIKDLISRFPTNP